MMTTDTSPLATAPVHAVLPAADLARARRFYAEVLGLEIADVPTAGGFMAAAGGGSALFVYETQAAPGSATQAMFAVADLDSVMAGLKTRGVVFEEYDLPGLKTTGGVAEREGMKSAWFKDSEGNTVAVSQR